LIEIFYISVIIINSNEAGDENLIIFDPAFFIRRGLLFELVIQEKFLFLLHNKICTYFIQ